MPEAIRKLRRRYVVDDWYRKWSTWVAGFWGAMGAAIIILSALLAQQFDWRVGALLIVVSVSVAIARALKQPGTE